jgi:TonB family protein
MRFSNFPLILLVTLLFSLTFIVPNVYAQKAQLSLTNIITALSSNKVTLAERNEILTGAVKERGITFELTLQIEKELENRGADKNLLEAIKQKSVIVKIEPTPKPTPTATPMPTPTPVELDFAYYKKQADENAAKGELDTAITNYNKSIELNPKNPSVYLNRALVFYKKKDYEMAIADYDKVIEINPKELIAYSNRANSFEKLGNTEKAVADYKKILEIDDKNEAAVNNLKRIEEERAREIQRQKDEIAALAQTENNKEKAKEEQTIVKTESTDNSQIVELGRINNSVIIEMATPVYSQIAKSLNLQGQVTVQIMIDETGKVTSAESSEGHRLLRESAELAARRSKFKPAIVDGKAVKSKGYIVYNFVR